MTDLQLARMLTTIVVCAFAAGFIFGYNAAPVQPCCTSVREQLAAITTCRDFTIVDRDNCGPATQEYINERVGVDLNCGAWYTSVSGCTWTVTMGEAAE